MEPAPVNIPRDRFFFFNVREGRGVEGSAWGMPHRRAQLLFLDSARCCSTWAVGEGLGGKLRRIMGGGGQRLPLDRAPGRRVGSGGVAVERVWPQRRKDRRGRLGQRIVVEMARRASELTVQRGKSGESHNGISHSERGRRRKPPRTGGQESRPKRGSMLQRGMI